MGEGAFFNYILCTQFITSTRRLYIYMSRGLLKRELFLINCFDAMPIGLKSVLRRRGSSRFALYRYRTVVERCQGSTNNVTYCNTCT